MTRHGIILIGGGGHAKVVFDALRDADAQVVGFVDDHRECALSGQLDHLGSIESLVEDAEVIIAIGDVATRRRVISRIGGVRVTGPVIHRGAIVSPSAQLGEGVLIGPGAIVNADARIESHAIVNTGAVVEHDCTLGVNTHVGPGVVLGGGVVVGDDTLVGLGSRVLPGIQIGDGCVVGGGAVVTRDIGDGETVVGVPAKVMGGVGR